MKTIEEQEKQHLPGGRETMKTIAATVSELIEILREYPGDWPVMIPNPEMNDHCNVLHGVYTYEGLAHQIKDYYYEFREQGLVAPDEKNTGPALLLGDYWEKL